MGMSHLPIPRGSGSTGVRRTPAFHRRTRRDGASLLPEELDDARLLGGSDGDALVDPLERLREGPGSPGVVGGDRAEERLQLAARLRIAKAGADARQHAAEIEAEDVRLVLHDFVEM